jgi:hypothetical protein
LEIDPNSQAAFDEYSKKFKKNEKVKFTVSCLTRKTIRSTEQNNYYWGVVIKILADDLGYIGTGEKEQLHEELKSMFLVKVGKLGKPYVERTSVLDTKLFERYLEAIRSWASEFQNIHIPLPNEVEESDTYTRI